VKIGMFRGLFGIIHRQTCNRKYAKSCFRSIILMSGLQLVPGHFGPKTELYSTEQF